MRRNVFFAWLIPILATISLGFGLPHTGSAASPAAQQAEHPLERSVKTAFLFRFTEFITWPETAFASPEQPFVIGIAGSEKFVEELRRVVTGRLVNNRPVQIRRLGENDGLAGEQLIFISATERRRLPEIARAAPPGTLIVTEWEGAITQGSMINFVLANNRVRFEIALNTAERQGLRLSSRLLAVALAVHTETP